MRCGTYDRESDEVWKMTGDGEHKIVPRSIHYLDTRPELAPKVGQAGDRIGIGISFGCQDAPATAKEAGEAGFRSAIFRSGNRVGWNY